MHEFNMDVQTAIDWVGNYHNRQNKFGVTLRRIVKVWLCGFEATIAGPSRHVLSCIYILNTVLSDFVTL